MNFADFAGNAGVKKKLSYLLESERFPNAVLIEGEDGLGKSTLAGLVANALVCGGAGEKPCMTCRDCRTFAAGGHPDIVPIRGQGRSSSVSVDAIRKISADIEILPNQAPYRVYIIDDADSMTVQAQNALLKILEEPPYFVIFILTVPSRFSLLETIISRTQIMTLKPLEVDEAVDLLLSRFPEMSGENASEAVRAGGGNIGRALMYLNEDGAEIRDAVGDVIDCLTGGDEYRLMISLSRFEKNKELFLRFLPAFDETVRDSTVIRSGAENLVLSGDGEAEKLASKLSAASLADIHSLIRETVKYLNRNIYDPLVLARFCAKLWETVS